LGTVARKGLGGCWGLGAGELWGAWRGAWLPEPPRGRGLSFLHPTAAVRQCMGPQPLEANTLYTPHSTHHPNPTHHTPHTPNPQDLA
jgi:hypothetical protein